MYSYLLCLIIAMTIASPPVITTTCISDTTLCNVSSICCKEGCYEQECISAFRVCRPVGYPICRQGELCVQNKCVSTTPPPPSTGSGCGEVQYIFLPPVPYTYTPTPPPTTTTISPTSSPTKKSKGHGDKGEDIQGAGIHNSNALGKVATGFLFIGLPSIIIFLVVALYITSIVWNRVSHSIVKKRGGA